MSTYAIINHFMALVGTISLTRHRYQNWRTLLVFRPGAAGQGVCGCPDLSLGYNPNTEAGGLTQFHCTTALAWDQLPVRLGAGARCYLRCGYILVAAIHCRWT